MTLLKPVAGAVFFLTFFIAAMGLESLVMADSTILLGGGKTFSVTCTTGKLSQPSHDGKTFALKCEGSGIPQPDPTPTPPPSTQCAPPTSGSALKAGQEIVQLSTRPLNRHFCSSDYPKGSYISWGPYSSSSAPSLTVIVSETPDNLDASSVDRACFSGATTGGLTVASSGRACPLKSNTRYYLTMHPSNPVSGRFSCSGQCKWALFNSKK